MSSFSDPSEACVFLVSNEDEIRKGNLMEEAREALDTIQEMDLWAAKLDGKLIEHPTYTKFKGLVK